MNRLGLPAYDYGTRKDCHIGALISHSQNENIESLSEEDRPL
jgi:hypothetical protein